MKHEAAPDATLHKHEGRKETWWSSLVITTTMSKVKVFSNATQSKNETFKINFGLKLGLGRSEHSGCASQDAQVNLSVRKSIGAWGECNKSIVGQRPLGL